MLYMSIGGCHRAPLKSHYIITVSLTFALPAFKKIEQAIGKFLNYRSLPFGGSSPRNRGSTVGIQKYSLAVQKDVIEFTVVEPKLFS